MAESLTRAEVDYRVQQVVSAGRRGESIEDDSVELKGKWPEPKQARQLAGAANKAAGEPLIWVIGADEDGNVYPTSGTDPAQWWNRMAKPFDQLAPRVVRHQVVFVSEAESVVAILFDTQDVPYVVRNDGGNRDVPLRTMTGTRSAHRNELIMMLLPRIHVPAIEIVAAHVTIEGFKELTRSEASISFNGWVKVLIDHRSDEYVFFPRAYMKSIVKTEVGGPVILATEASGGKAISEQPRYGVRVNAGNVEATGSGAFSLQFGNSVIGLQRENYAQAQWISLEVRLPTIGSPDVVGAEVRLTRTDRGQLDQDLGSVSFDYKRRMSETPQ